MGIATRMCSENKKEIRGIKKTIERLKEIRFQYPDMILNRKMQFAVKMNELFERMKYLRVNKLNSQSKEWDFTYVFKKDRVKNRLA